MSYNKNYWRDYDSPSNGEYYNYSPNTMPQPPYPKPQQHCPKHQQHCPTPCPSACPHSSPTLCPPYYPQPCSPPIVPIVPGSVLPGPIFPPGSINTSAFALATTSIPSTTDTAISITPTTVQFNTPLSSQNIVINRSTITFPNAGTYYVQFTLLVSSTTTSTLTITTTGTNATSSPSIYPVSLVANQTNYPVTYTALVTTSGNATLTYSIHSNAATSVTISRGQLVAFQVA